MSLENFLTRGAQVARIFGLDDEAAEAIGALRDAIAEVGEALNDGSAAALQQAQEILDRVDGVLEAVEDEVA